VVTPFWKDMEIWRGSQELDASSYEKDEKKKRA
jgi:hypothetical protein